MPLSAPIAKSYRSSLIVAVSSQLIGLILGAGALDFGQLFQWVILAIGAYWGMALIVLMRRPLQPTKGDLLAIRYGFPLILVLVICLTSLRWARAGLQSSWL